jgi:hypothetical protein
MTALVSSKKESLKSVTRSERDVILVEGAEESFNERIKNFTGYVLRPKRTS